MKHEILKTRAFKEMSGVLWFFWRAITFQPIIMDDIRGYLENFYQKDERCIPSFSFSSIGLYRNIIESILPSHPTLVICLCRRLCPRTEDVSEPEFYEGLDKHFNTQKLFQSLPNDERQYSRFFEGFHLNRYTSDYKVIVTDWSSRRSRRAVTDDPNYPIKSVIILTNQFHGECADYRAEFNHIVSCSSFDISGGMLCHSQHLYNDLRFKGLRRSNSISIAFAGRDIKSSMLEIRWSDFNPEEIERKACDFKNQLENQCFPIDDGRVLGFYFEETNCRDRYKEQYKLQMFRTFSEIFPSIKLFKIQVKFNHGCIFEGKRGNVGFENRIYVLVHLIHI
ncbi:uncharacterized protein LOC141854628 isoform X2 [Brevipalpus obovatus]